MNYKLTIPTGVVMGKDAVLETGKLLQEHGVNRVLCIYDVGIKELGLANSVVAAIKEAGIEAVIFDEVTSDPPDKLIDEVGDIALKANVDAVVGIGGGSSLDTAKAVNVLLGGNPGPINKYFGFNVEAKPGKPLFLIPTTSGTGAEVSNVAVVTDTQTGIKCAVFNEKCCTPTLAIVDPEMIKGLPAGLTASTGIDTLAHAIEAYTNKIQNPLSDPFAKEAIELVGKYLERAVKDGNDMEAREGMCQACTIAGLAMGHTMLHLGHGLGTPFGGRFHIQHGTACGMFLAGTVEYIAPVKAERIHKIGELLGMKLVDKLSAEEIGLEVAAFIRDLLDRINFPTLISLGIKESDFDVIVDDALVDICAGNCPRPLERDALLAIVRKEYEER